METKQDAVRKARTHEGVLGRSADDEPVFVLVARDVTAPDTVRAWAHLAARQGSPAAKIGQAMLDAEAMEAWQRSHGAKVPD